MVKSRITPLLFIFFLLTWIPLGNSQESLAVDKTELEASLEKLNELQGKIAQKQNLLEKTIKELNRTESKLEAQKVEKEKTKVKIKKYGAGKKGADRQRSIYEWNLNHHVKPHKPVYERFLELIQEEKDSYQRIKTLLDIERSVVSFRSPRKVSPILVDVGFFEEKSNLVSPVIWDIVLENLNQHIADLQKDEAGFRELLKELEEFIEFENKLDSLARKNQEKYSVLHAKQKKVYDKIKKEETILVKKRRKLLAQRSESQSILEDIFRAVADLKKGLEGRLFFEEKGKLEAPVKAKLVRKFGRYYDKELGNSLVNRGLDYKVTSKDLVHSIFYGKVIYAKQLVGYGETVIINHGGKYFSLYGNLGEILVGIGEEVAKGEEIAYIDGSIESEIMHFEIRREAVPIDPEAWLKN